MNEQEEVRYRYIVCTNIKTCHDSTSLSTLHALSSEVADRTVSSGTGLGIRSTSSNRARTSSHDSFLDGDRGSLPVTLSPSEIAASRCLKDSSDEFLVSLGRVDSRVLIELGSGGDNPRLGVKVSVIVVAAVGRTLWVTTAIPSVTLLILD